MCGYVNKSDDDNCKTKCTFPLDETNKYKKIIFNNVQNLQFKQIMHIHKFTKYILHDPFPKNIVQLILISKNKHLKFYN